MQEKKPLVTIVTITFNLIKSGREKTLRQCLESVHNQTYENIEHLVVDGGSKDGSVDLIKEYANKGLIKYVSEPDNGIYDALNKGIKMANGKYIAFLHSDDFYHGKDGVMKTVKALEKEGADFSYAPAIIEKEDGTNLKGNHTYFNPKISKVFFSMPFCHQTMFTRRDVMLKEGMFDTNFKSAGDYDFLLRICLKKYKSVLVNNKFTTFRLGGFSDTDRELSNNEVAKAYHKNFSKLINISKEDCKKIFCREYSGISKELAVALSNYESYFSIKEYKKSFGFRKKMKRVVKIFIDKINFIIFSPRKFAVKYLAKLK
ncbi:MAG: Glycosyltransferase, group 2 family protein [uncultured bacterium]|nr:MAG: Glycosyltransferase, group 2 family protein [uncultured bacterium]OFY32105.1 MAG: hypothetical protein A2X09_15375 [Bacteroidetes bacterium GWF2_43_11]HBR79242.1 hypothetical protein [Candidatus Moranbacteria bacterium]HCU01353.1 hypothetical protein [Candidatus Nomurabacteria bacterium]